MRSDGYANIQFKTLEDNMKIEVQKPMGQAALTHGKVELLTEESGRVMRMVLVESEKFAAKVAADMAEMDAKAECFRAARAGLKTVE